MVQYRCLNLLNDFSSLGTFDIVYCRNVLIYFDQPTKANVLNRISKMMMSDGFMLLGAAETVVGLTEAFKPMADRRGLYVLSGAAPIKTGLAANVAAAQRPVASPSIVPPVRPALAMAGAGSAPLPSSAIAPRPALSGTSTSPAPPGLRVAIQKVRPKAFTQPRPASVVVRGRYSQPTQP